MVEVHRVYEMKISTEKTSIIRINVKYAGNPMPILVWHDENGQEIPWGEMFQGYKAIFNNYLTTMTILEDNFRATEDIFTLIAQNNENITKIKHISCVTSEGRYLNNKKKKFINDLKIIKAN